MGEAPRLGLRERKPVLARTEAGGAFRAPRPGPFLPSSGGCRVSAAPWRSLAALRGAGVTQEHPPFLSPVPP